ncbi:MAG: hypothetical protein COB16_15500 [Rhodobacteraceae bacterium]|nr:MAG: hypothetical protein COB16_15500 [Paracoccaceae bacterium]
MSTQTATLEDVTAVAAPKDLAKDVASSLRPAESTKMQGIYTNPSTQVTVSVAPAYTGPSYTERANGDLLGQVMADLQSLQDNELAAMQESQLAIVETALGRSLTSSETLDDFLVHESLSSDESKAGSKTRRFESTLYTAMGESIGLHKLYFSPNSVLPDDDAEIISNAIDSLVNQQIRDIVAALAETRIPDKTEGFSASEPLPPLSEDELDILREDLTAQRLQQLEDGTITFEINRP